MNIHDQSKWCPVHESYPDILATKTLSMMKPHDRESFLTRCHAWYLEAVSQILRWIDLADPVLNVLQDIEPSAVEKGVASQTTAGLLARNLQHLAEGSSIQTIDQQWRSMLIDNAMANGGWETKGVTEFWQSMHTIIEYQELANCMLQ